MEKKSSNIIVKRLLKLSIYAQVTLLVLIFLFTKSIFYSIIFFLGTLISILGFFAMIKMIDRVLGQGKGQMLFFLVVVLKMAVIAGVVFLISRISHSDAAVLYHVLGLSIVIIAIGLEGIYRVYRSVFNGSS
jgi:hypothetical protein